MTRALRDANIMTVPNLTGELARTQQSKNGDAVSVFGFLTPAQRNDVAGRTRSYDLTAAVNAAIAALGAAGGGTLLFPFGDYRFDGTLSVLKSNVTLQGAGRGGTTFAFTSATADSIYWNGATAPGIYDCGIYDVAIVNTATRTAGIALRLALTNQMTVERVTIDAAWQAFDIYVTNNVLLRSVIGTNIKGTQALKWWAPADGSARSDVLTLTDSVFNLQNNGGNGIVLDGLVNTLRTFGCGVLDANYGLLVQNTGGSTSNFPGFVYCWDLEIDGTNSTAVRLEAGQQFEFIGSDFFNLSTASGPIMTVLADASGSDTGSIRMSGCRLGGGKQQALAFNGRDLVMTGCNIGGGSGTTFNCIDLQSSAQDVVIVGNKIGTWWGSPINKYVYGVGIANGVFRSHISDNSFYGCNGEVQDNSTSGTSYVGPYLNRAGTPNWPNTIMKRSDNNTGVFDDKIYNTTAGAGVVAQRSFATGTTNSYVIDALKDNNGAPYMQRSAGSAVTTFYADCNVHNFRTAAGVSQFAIGQLLPNYTSDSAAAAGGIVVGGFYRNGNAVQQRIA
ncbi:hypothetical protein VL15_07210 [Burkholderia cepacia]|uniref:Pectate lyase superfamily protein domain-containing protein n=1 Tax=Burkholderia cepacia TaxID=292 RepID=A0A0J5XDK2_BURCE|nr:hypothetical protein [Burkholderia cepacia]KML60892.1 hypothetical protein VL15_07210 [Burkholderia cepacia]